MNAQNTTPTLHKHVIVKYSDYYVAFLDALGFSEKINRSAGKIDESSTKDALSELSAYFTVAKGALKKFATKPETASFVISDSVILAVPSNTADENSVEVFRELCSTVQKIQWELAKYNIWFRGAITKGPCWVDQKASQITGPAYIKALELEKTSAKYPRVIIDPAVISSLKIKNRAEFTELVNQEGSNNYKRSSGPIFDWERTNSSYVHLTDDTMSFIDYFGLGISNNEWSELDVVMDYIERSLFNQKTYEKYRWLVNYLLVRVGSDSATGSAPQHLGLIYERLRYL